MGALKLNYETVNAYALPGMMKDVEIRFRPVLQESDLEMILRIVSEETGISVEKIKSKSRITEKVIARHIFCAVAKKYTNAKLKRIADFIKFSDHSSVIHSIEYYKEKTCVDVKFQELVRKIEMRIV